MSQNEIEIFICCSRKDIAIADKVCAALDKESISYFVDRQDIGECVVVSDELKEKIASSKLFLLLASEDSYGSEYIINQLDYAVDNTDLVTYVIDGAKLPLEIDYMFGYMDWYNIDDHPIDTVLMDGLRRKLGYGYRKSVLTERERFLLGLPDKEFERVEESGKFGYRLKSTGEIVVPVRYDYCDVSFREGLAKVKSSNDVGFVDKTGAEVVALQYFGAKSFREGLAMVYSERGFGFVDKTGREVIPLKYLYASSFSEGLASVLASEARFGFINHNGEMAIPFEYDDADSFSEGLAAVRRDGLWGYIDRMGKEVIPIKLTYDSVRRFRGGLACVSLNRKYGFIDKSGREVIPLKYDFNTYTLVAGFINGATAKVELNGEEFWIDKEGNRVEQS